MAFTEQEISEINSILKDYEAKTGKEHRYVKKTHRYVKKSQPIQVEEIIKPSFVVEPIAEPIESDQTFALVTPPPLVSEPLVSEPVIEFNFIPPAVAEPKADGPAVPEDFIWPNVSQEPELKADYPYPAPEPDFYQRLIDEIANPPKIEYTPTYTKEEMSAELEDLRADLGERAQAAEERLEELDAVAGTIPYDATTQPRGKNRIWQKLVSSLNLKSGLAAGFITVAVAGVVTHPEVPAYVWNGTGNLFNTGRSFILDLNPWQGKVDSASKTVIMKPEAAIKEKTVDYVLPEQKIMTKECSIEDPLQCRDDVFNIEDLVMLRLARFYGIFDFEPTSLKSKQQLDEKAQKDPKFYQRLDEGLKKLHQLNDPKIMVLGRPDIIWRIYPGNGENIKIIKEPTAIIWDETFKIPNTLQSS